MFNKRADLVLLNMAVAARRLRCERERLVKAVEYLSERGWIEVQVSDLVHGYQKLRPLGDTERLADALYQRLIEREAAEVGRLDDVFALAQADRCLAQRLSQHFGEALAQPCGRCTFCRGEGELELPPIAVRGIGSSAKAAIEQLRKKYPDHLADPRSRARFLCGLSGPAFTRSKLSRDSNFGICHRVPFSKVLEEMQTL